MAKEEGAYMLLTNCPFCILFFKRGLELMQESGEPMEFGIFDFSRCFQGLLVRRVMGQWGLEWKPGDVFTNLRPEDRRQRGGCSLFGISFYFERGISYARKLFRHIHQGHHDTRCCSSERGRANRRYIRIIRLIPFQHLLPALLQHQLDSHRYQNQ